LAHRSEEAGRGNRGARALPTACLAARRRSAADSGRSSEGGVRGRVPGGRGSGCRRGNGVNRAEGQSLPALDSTGRGSVLECRRKCRRFAHARAAGGRLGRLRIGTFDPPARRSRVEGGIRHGWPVRRGVARSGSPSHQVGGAIGPNKAVEPSARSRPGNRCRRGDGSPAPGGKRPAVE